MTNKTVAVFGAYGHTGKFVVETLLKRGLTPVLSGRSRGKLDELGARYPGLEVRAASIDDPATLDKALERSIAVINCAGPFLDTATPVIEAALRKGLHYLDMAAEQECVINTYVQFAGKAEEAGIIILPAMAFYGGLGDLLATAAMGDWTSADAISIKIALDSWLPTGGTRLTGKRNTSPRLMYLNKTLTPVTPAKTTLKWQFAEPFGLQEVVDFPLSEIITLSKHLDVAEISTCINTKPMEDIHNDNTPTPQAADDSGRSSQVFLMEALVRSGDNTRIGRASGRDIYAITAPLIVEAAIRIIQREIKKYAGVFSPGELFDAEDFLKYMNHDGIVIAIAEQK